MSVRRLAAEQPEGFAFTPENLDWAKGQIKKYPEGKQASAVLALLWRAQEQMGGWLPEPALRYVADMLGMAYIRIYEIATFYTMFNLAPVGRYYVQVCGTTPCWLRGADDIKAACRKLIGEPNHVTDDGLFSWTEVECLGRLRQCAGRPDQQILLRGPHARKSRAPPRRSESRPRDHARATEWAASLGPDRRSEYADRSRALP